MERSKLLGRLGSRLMYAFYSGAFMRRFAALFAVVLLAACSSEIDQSTRPKTVTGSYQLRTYGGRPLPAIVSSDSGGVTRIVSGEFVLGSDQSWSETRVYRFTQGTTERSFDFGSSGSWAFLRDFAFMMFNDKVYGYQFSGTAAGGDLVLNLTDGNALVYGQ